MVFSPEYWSGQLFPSPRDLPNPVIKLRSYTLQADSLPAELPGKPIYKLFKASQMGLVLKNPPANSGDTRDTVGSIPGSGRSPGGGYGNPIFQYSWLENPHAQRSLEGYSP